MVKRIRRPGRYMDESSLGKSMEEEAQEYEERRRRPTEQEYYQGNPREEDPIEDESDDPHEDEKYHQAWLKKHINPRNPNKIPIGKIIDDENGIEKLVLIELNHPKAGKYVVLAEPTAKGKKTKAYQEIRRMMGDDWYSDITDSWFETKTLPAEMQVKIHNVLEGLSGFTAK